MTWRALLFSLFPIALVTARPTLHTVTASLHARRTNSTRKHSRSVHHSLRSIRGGAGGDDNIFQLVSPYWTSFSRLVQEKVEPAVKDPKTFFQQQGQAVKSFVQRQSKAAKERHDYIGENPQEAVVGLLGVGRIVKLSLAAWILAELLYQAGFFNNTDGLAPKLKQAWREHAEGPVSEVRYRIQEWWYQERLKGGILNWGTWREPSLLLDKIRTLPSRYQFAVGAGSGMILSPLIWSMTGRVFKSGVIVYLFAELNEYWRENSCKGDSIVEVCGFKGKAGEAGEFCCCVTEWPRDYSVIINADLFVSRSTKWTGFWNRSVIPFVNLCLTLGKFGWRRNIRGR